MKKTKLAVIDFDGETRYIDESEITLATIGDMLDADWSSDECGICEEFDKNDDGETLYTGKDFFGKLTLDELKEIETDWYCVKYWDGNNQQIDIFEYYDTEEVEIISDKDHEPNPKWHYCYSLKMEDGSEVRTIQSNCSGSISPYYVPDDEEERE